MTTYNKLVRDKVPKIISSKGIKCKWRVASDEEFWVKLKEKLKEEIDEFLEDDSIEELADVMEVISEIRRHYKEEVVSVQRHKYENKGGFYEKIILEEVED